MRNPGNETIAAIATGVGRGIGIIRISGPEALAVGSRIFRGRGGRPLAAAQPLRLLLGAVVDPTSGEPVDEAFAVHMRAGNSYTGEPCVEIQCHGGTAVLDAVLRAALEAGAKPAGPGEFTKRAFFSGRIDLSQAEAVAELIGAQTERARRSALSRLHGSFGKRVRGVRGRLLDQIAAAEAILDHGDEEVGEGGPKEGEIQSLLLELRELIANGESMERRPRGPRVVIAGGTNSGKSSIFNMLQNNNRSIVSSIPGTTRDYIEGDFSIGGILLTLVDTAGLRETGDPVEMEGVRRSRQQMLDADLLILTIDGSLPLDAGGLNLIEEFRERSPLVVLTKSDLPEAIDRSNLLRSCGGLPLFTLSTLEGCGCPELALAIAERCRENAGSEAGTAPNFRHREALRTAVDSLERATDLISQDDTFLDQTVAELHRAVAALGEITGETAGEAILERVFSRFCIGK